MAKRCRTSTKELRLSKLTKMVSLVANTAIVINTICRKLWTFVAPAEPILYPAVAQYASCYVEDLKKGDKKSWCACGLSKNQPWCDGSHKGTGLKSLKWEVPKDQSMWSICGCKYTKDPPYCDATHTDLPEEVNERKKNCRQKNKHNPDVKLCTGCGWVPDF